MRAEELGVQADTGDSFRKEPRVLPRGHAVAEATRASGDEPMLYR